MAGDVRLIGVSRDLETGTPTLDVAVGKSDRVRRALLTEKQLIRLMRDSATQLEALRADRERKT